MIEVVGAVIRREHLLLIAQRPPGKNEALFWEFPGGKLEAGESPQECLRREIMEELGILIRVGKAVGDVLHDYGERLIHLTCYWAELEAGDPQPLQCHDWRWITHLELGNYEFAPADRPIVEVLKLFSRSP